jgi:hypothetical protein
MQHEISDISFTENVNFIRIYYEKFSFLHFVNKIEFLINRSVEVECHLKQRK